MDDAMDLDVAVAKDPIEQLDDEFWSGYVAVVRSSDGGIEQLRADPLMKHVWEVENTLTWKQAFEKAIIVPELAADKLCCTGLDALRSCYNHYSGVKESSAVYAIGKGGLAVLRFLEKRGFQWKDDLVNLYARAFYNKNIPLLHFLDKSGEPFAFSYDIVFRISEMAFMRLGAPLAFEDHPIVAYLSKKSEPFWHTVLYVLCLETGRVEQAKQIHDTAVQWLSPREEESLYQMCLKLCFNWDEVGVLEYLLGPGHERIQRGQTQIWGVLLDSMVQPKTIAYLYQKGLINNNHYERQQLLLRTCACSYESTEYLLEQGYLTDTPLTFMNKEMLFRSALKRSTHDTIDLLLTYVIRPYERVWWNLVSIAIEYGSLDQVRYLLEEKKLPLFNHLNAQYGTGAKEPLQFAVYQQFESQSLAICKYLVTSWAQRDITLGAFREAIEVKQFDVASYLLESKAAVLSPCDTTTLSLAIHTLKVEFVELCIRYGIQPALCPEAVGILFADESLKPLHIHRQWYSLRIFLRKIFKLGVVASEHCLGALLKDPDYNDKIVRKRILPLFELYCHTAKRGLRSDAVDNGNDSPPQRKAKRVAK